MRGDAEWNGERRGGAEREKEERETEKNINCGEGEERKRRTRKKVKREGNQVGIERGDAKWKGERGGRKGRGGEGRIESREEKCGTRREREGRGKETERGKLERGVKKE